MQDPNTFTNQIWVTVLMVDLSGNVFIECHHNVEKFIDDDAWFPSSLEVQGVMFREKKEISCRTDFYKLMTVAEVTHLLFKPILLPQNRNVGSNEIIKVTTNRIRTRRIDRRQTDKGFNFILVEEHKLTFIVNLFNYEIILCVPRIGNINFLSKFVQKNSFFGSYEKKSPFT